MHHGYEPFGASHTEVNAVCNGPFLKTISHVADVLFLNVIEVVETVEARFGADGSSLVWYAKTNPFKALVDYNVGVDYSCHAVDVIIYLLDNGEEYNWVSVRCFCRNEETCKLLSTSQHSCQGDQSRLFFSRDSDKRQHSHRMRRFARQNLMSRISCDETRCGG